MPTSFLGVVWQTFVRLYGPVLAFLGIAISLTVWVVKPDARVPVAVIVPAGLVAVILLLVLLEAGRSAWHLRTPGLPRVLYATAAMPGLPRVQLVCLLEPSEMFSHGVQVGFYFQNEDGFELLVGIGRVLNVQDDKRVQVGLTRALPGQEATVNQISQNARNVLEKVRVKPWVPHDVLGPANDEELHE